MLNIGKYARALPSLLDLRERGTGPREFSEQVVGTVELTSLYLLQNREVVLSTTNVAPAVGGNSYSTPLVVPAGEVWYVHEYCVNFAPGAGAAIEGCPSLNYDAQAFIALAPYQAAAATQNCRVSAQKFAFIATPGSEFTFLVKSVTLAPVVVGALVVTKLKL